MFEKLELIGNSNSQKEKFAKAANNLLNHCFILKKKEDTRQDYIYIKDNKEQFALVFDLLGYDLRIDEDLGLISISNRNGTGRLQLTKFESIMFLIIKLLYLEKRNDLSTNGDNVIVTVQDIRDKYNVLKIKNNTLEVFGDNLEINQINKCEIIISGKIYSCGVGVIGEK